MLSIGRLIKFVTKSKIESLKNTSPIQTELYSPYGLIAKAPKNTAVLILENEDGQSFVSMAIQQNVIELQENDVVVSNGKSKIFLRADGGIEISTNGGQASIDLSAEGDLNIKANKMNISANQLAVDADSAFKKQITNQEKNIGADHTHKVNYIDANGAAKIVTSEGVD